MLSNKEHRRQCNAVSNTECSNDTILHCATQQKAKFQRLKHISAINISNKFLTFGSHVNMSQPTKYKKYILSIITNNWMIKLSLRDWMSTHCTEKKHLK